MPRRPDYEYLFKHANAALERYLQVFNDIEMLLEDYGLRSASEPEDLFFLLKDLLEDLDEEHTT